VQIEGKQSQALITGTCGERYDWQVRAADRAGNIGAWSDRWTFSLSPQETRLPDLVVSAFGGPRAAQPGQSIGPRSRLAVSNQGEVEAGEFSVDIVISPDDEIDTSDQMLIGGREYVSGVAPGESVTVRMVAQEIPADWPPGQAYIGVILDPLGEQEESNQGNNTASFPIVILQPDQPPEAQILEPQDGALFYSKTSDQAGFYSTVGLVGEATDNEDDPRELTVEWYSDVEGFLDSGSSITARLHAAGRDSAREHKITLRVTDSAGNRVEDTITVIVEPPSIDQPPEAQILEPQNGERFADDTADEVGFYSTLELVGEATDNEDDPSQLTFEWYSDAEGFLGSGNGIAAQLHTDGFEAVREHRITLRVTDSAGNRVEDTITVIISPPPEFTYKSGGFENVWL
jgi:hypothetical protein